MTTDRAARHESARKEIRAVLEGEDDLTARMATVSAMLHEAFADRFIWTGFYVVDPKKPDELVVGPYQGRLGCLRIPFGKGVCGAAAATGETQLVDDVHAFEGHIACDPRSRAEVVVPVRGAGGALLAVLDIDAAEPGAFDAEDARALEALVGEVFAG